jgi:Bacterial type II/III secretion system short domain
MKIMGAFAMMSLLMWGQDAAPAQVNKLIQLRYVDPSRVQNLVGFFANGGDLAMRSDDRLHVIYVRGTAQAVAAVEEAVKKLDVPPSDFELTVYLISTSPQTGDQLPEALVSAAKQLHGVFAYKGYQLLDSFVLRGRDGERGTANGTISKEGKNSTYTFRYERATVSGEAPKIVNLHNLDLQVRYSTGTFNKDGYPITHDTGLNTDVDARDGQKVVVGKSDMNNGENPLILVVTAKVVE